MSSNPSSEGPTRVIRFEDGEPARPAAGAPRVEPVQRAADPVQAPPTATRTRGGERDWRPWLLGGAAAVALGVVAALLLSPKEEAEPSRTAVVESRRTETTRVDPPTAGAAAAVSGPYQDPDAASVERALFSVRTDFAQGGVTAVQRQARACFDSLARAPSYPELDYCLAYDAYGAALAKRLAQGQPLPAGSWFSESEARAVRTAQTVIGEAGDPAARLLDIRRLTVAVAAENPARTGGGGARADEAAPTRRVATAQAEPRVTVAPEPPPASEPERPPEPRVARSAPEPRPAPVARAAVEPAPAAARPSFNCRYARSRSERLVCSDPVLAAADWRLHNVFERAWANAPDRRALRAEQDRWLAARENAAPDPRAVLQVYETRIDELAANY